MKLIKTLALALLLSISQITFADDLPLKAGSTSDSVQPHLSKAHLSAGLGFAMFRSTAGWAINGGYLRQAFDDSALYWGGAVSLNMWSFSSAPNTSAGATGIQLLPTAVYFLAIDKVEFLRPYIGVAAGPHLYFNKFTNAQGQTSSDATIFFEVLARPGVAFNLGNAVALQVEPQFGLLDNEFIFLPQASASIPL